MAKQEISEEDYDLYYRMASLQHAMISNVVAPVCVWRGDEGGIESMGLPGMYYDCCEDSEIGIAVMKKRIALAGGDIKKHYNNHFKTIAGFEMADAAIVRQDRREFGNICGKICEYSEIQSNLVCHHLARLDDEGFLTYPTAPKGASFDIVDSNRTIIPEMRFNGNGSFGSFGDDLNIIRWSIEYFVSRKGVMPYFTLPAFGKEGSAGFYDKTYGENIKTARTLLERVGIRVAG